MWFKRNIIKQSYEYNKNVPFDVAFKALREGYIIKHANYSDVYLKYLNGRIFELLSRDNGKCTEVTEFSTFEMLIDKWKILPLGCTIDENKE